MQPPKSLQAQPRAPSKALTWPQIRATTNQQVAAFISAGRDPYSWQLQRRPDGSVVYDRSTTTFLPKDQRDYATTFFDLKRRRCFSSIEAKALHRFAPELHFFCHKIRNLWCGVIRLGAPVLAVDVGVRGQNTIESLRRFFENSPGDARLVFAILHNDRIRKWDDNLRPLLDVHAHFLFTIENNRHPNFKRSFSDKFPDAGYTEPVRNTHGHIAYILRTPDLHPLIDCGRDYLEWSRATEGKRRQSCYGLFKQARAQWKADRQHVIRKIIPLPHEGSYREVWLLRDKPTAKTGQRRSSDQKIVELDTVVGETIVRRRTGNTSAFVVKNARVALSLSGTIAAPIEAVQCIEVPTNGAELAS